MLVITDIDGAYGCGWCNTSQILDSSGVRLDWAVDSGSHLQKLTGSITFMGKLVASPGGAFLDDD